MQSVKAKRWALVCAMCSFGWTAGGGAWAATPGAVETWDTDIVGWDTGTTSTVLAHSAGGGNPNGHAQLRKDLGGAFDEIGIATTVEADFLGDFAADGIGEASIDINMFNSSVLDASIRFRPDVANNGWSYSFGPIAPNANLWEAYTTGLFDPTWSDVDAIANGWVQDSAPSPSFATLMSSVGWAEVRFDTAAGVSTLVGVDNFRLDVPEPGTASLAALGGVALLARRKRA